MGNVSNEAHIDGNPHAISKAEMMKIIDQMNRSICKINYLNSNGTGFFCKILISEENQNENYFLGLLTCNHVLDEDIKGKTIKLIINEITYPLYIDEPRKIFSDKMKDITIIEIRRGELPNLNFLFLDENIFDKNPENIYQDIYILHFEFGKEEKYSTGVIASFDKTLINNTKIFYSCSTQPGSSGGPVINSKNYKVIGIHKGFDKMKGLNRGLFIGDAITKFKKWYKTKSSNNNENYNNDENLNKENGEIYNNMQYFPQNNYNIPNNNLNNNMINMNNYNIPNNNFSNNMNNMNYYNIPNNNLINNMNNIINNINDVKNNINNDINNLNNYININNNGNINNNIYNNFSNPNNKIFFNINKIDNLNENMNNIYSISNYNNQNNLNKNRINNNNYNVNGISNNLNNQNGKINNNVNMNINNNLNQINGFHEHPLFLSHQNDKMCNICLQKINEINGNLSYRCNSCSIIICQRCLKAIFNGKINLGLHHHKLKLKYNNHQWNCIKCGYEYGSDKCISLYCEQCNLNFCDICYLSQQDEQEQEQINNDNNEENDDKAFHEHNLIYANLNDICYFCCCWIDNKSGYKCENNDLILCHNCYEIIYIYGYKVNNSLHRHDLKPSIREKWQCDICKKHFEKKISFLCKKCDFDVCYNCYFKKGKEKEDKSKESDEEDDEVKKYVTDIVKVYKNINDCANQ